MKFRRCEYCKGRCRKVQHFWAKDIGVLPRFVKCPRCDGQGEVEMSRAEIAEDLFFEKVDRADKTNEQKEKFK